MNNRYIITISLYIILNSFFILIISQSKFNNNIDSNNTIEVHPIKKSKKQETLELIERDFESLSKTSIWVFKNNFEGNYVFESDFDKIFNQNKLKEESKVLFINICDIVNKNKNALKIALELPESVESTLSHNVEVVANIFSSNLDDRSNLEFRLNSNNKFIIRLNAND